MKSLEEVLRRSMTPRIIGFDDAPFARARGSEIHLAGIVCAQTTFEGMLWGCATRDGLDATEVVVQMLTRSKFHDQVHAVLLDGLAFGGFNLVDLPTLSRRLDRPCIAVMRKRPNMPSIRRALSNFHDCAYRLHLIERAGPVHDADPFYFQVQGATPEVVAKLLPTLTAHGNVPEALRLAHLINSAIKTGESSQRA